MPALHIFIFEFETDSRQLIRCDEIFKVAKPVVHNESNLHAVIIMIIAWNIFSLINGNCQCIWFFTTYLT